MNTTQESFLMLKYMSYKRYTTRRGEKMKTKAANQVKYALFGALLGSCAGAVVWGFLKVMAMGTEFVWEWIPGKWNISFYPVIIGVIGGVLMGLLHKYGGDYPEELGTVLGKIKKEKHYGYDKMLLILLCAMIPLVMGSSVGPEAGLVGIISALCYWVSDNMKLAHEDAKNYSEVGIAVSLSVLFHAPLFGLFAVEEDKKNESIGELTKSTKFVIYGLAIAASLGVYQGLSHLFGAGLAGFPSFASVELTLVDYGMMIVYMIAGCLLAVFYEATHRGFHKIANGIPVEIREVFGGLLLGLVGTFVPAVMFSGEEQMAHLMENYLGYAPLFMIVAAFLKIALTNACIMHGLRGGHFFPVIFAGACAGYGIAMLVFTESTGHVAFGAAIVTATLLGATMKKPLAVAMLLMICFPVRMCVWIFLAAVIGSKVFTREEEKEDLPSR